MYLKSIEVNGFKSFADRLIFQFKDGITGIVGPNGSGKSNVADAVRWVLGEQSAKQLRGSKMEDVIFSGTETRRAMGSSYVAITFDNSDKALPIDYDEVTVARRVYRSGESEYLINGSTCLLKDVKEMFFDTGIGKEGYSIIGQGQIDKILSGKPEDRRELFDEAAGIVKYKKRKAETVKNLESERQNLVRVNDILAELELQVGPLKKQSEKARTYLDLREELKSKDISMFIMEYDRLNAELEGMKKKQDTADSELKEAGDAYALSRSTLDELEKVIEDNSIELENSINTVNNNRLKSEKLDGEIKLFIQQIESLSGNERQFQERIEKLNDTFKAQEDEKKALTVQKDENEKQLKDCEDKKSAREDEINGLFSKIKSKEDETDECNQSIIRLINNSSELKAEQKKYETMLEQNSIKKAEMNQSLFRLKTAVRTASDELNIIKEQNDSCKKSIDELQEKIKGKRYNLNENDRKRREHEALYQEQQKQYMKAESELSTLNNLAERYEGFGLSVKKVMEKKNTIKGIIGVVSDIISVDEKYETAVEIALGGNIQNIVTDTSATAKKLVEYLKANKLGRATFLPISDITADADYDSSLGKEKGVLGPVSDFVKTKKEYSEIIKYLMGRFILVDNIDNALALAKKYRHTLRIVTLEGEFLNVGGSISGGSFKNKSNLLGRNREIKELTEKVSALKKEMNDTKSVISDFADEYKELSDIIAKLNTERENLLIEYNTVKIKYEQAKQALAKRNDEYSQAVKSTGSIETEKNNILSSLDALKEKLMQNEADTNKCKERINELSAELESDKSMRSKLHDIINRLSLDRTSFIQTLGFIEEKLTRCIQMMEQTRIEIHNISDTRKQTKSDIVKKKDDIEAVKESIKGLNTENEALTGRINELKETQAVLSDNRKNMQEKREKLADRRNELEKEQIRLSNQAEKLQGQFDSLTLYMWNEYELTYRSAKDNNIVTDIPYNELKSQTQALRKKIKSLGDVNVNSIEEYINVSERYTTMKKQHDDIIESEKRLLSFIDELDEKMRIRFTEEFDKINKQYNIVFKELFGGGRGVLELTEDEDILDAGIRIIAQPPGKTLKSVSMLSGGEKALSAIAILFAIQNLKPSPFCLLDEIEAALDDSNVKRFANYLNKLKKESQYIVITHRQGTMAAADTLYGITMQEKGVSTLVSVDLVEQGVK
jgi:chromosome segregation protein SMC